MKQYYYSDNENEFGPFTLDELKEKRIKKTTLVWTDGLSEWTTADTINELKNILVAEPPPLPKKETTKQTETVTFKKNISKVTNLKHDTSYRKENDATIVGVLLVIIPIVIQLTGVMRFTDISSYKETRMWVSIVVLLIRVGSTAWVVNIAKRQNRNTTGWGWFTFFFPGISLSIIGQLRKLKLRIEIDQNLSTEQQVNILLTKANEFYSEKRFIETIEILNKLLEIKNENNDARILRAKSYYQIKDYKNAQNDFYLLQNAEQLLSEVYLYLGNIESHDFCIDKAIKYWDIAFENGNKKASALLDRYSNYKGKFLLDSNEILKKIGSKMTVNEIGEGYKSFKYLSGFLEADGLLNIKKYKTEIILYEFGFNLTLSKLFKTFQFAVNYTEIKEIKLENSTLCFNLFDNTILCFDYDFKKDENKILSQLNNAFTENTGIESIFNNKTN